MHFFVKIFGQIKKKQYLCAQICILREVSPIHDVYSHNFYRVVNALVSRSELRNFVQPNSPKNLQRIRLSLPWG